MSTQPTTCTATILDQEVSATIVDRDVVANIATGPQEVLTVAVDGTHYHVEPDDIQPR